MLVLSLCGNNQKFFFRGEVGFPRFLRLFQGQGINTCMTIEEVVRNYIKETVKPLTPDQARLKALKGNVDRARLALQTARDQQRQRREAGRRAKASQARAAITTSLKGQI
jgi:galactitol-specific phosphotransferase system IIB component